MNARGEKKGARGGTRALLLLPLGNFSRYDARTQSDRGGSLKGNRIVNVAPPRPLPLIHSRLVFTLGLRFQDDIIWYPVQANILVPSPTSRQNAMSD